MSENTVAERIIDSLAFEVEALPYDDVLEISDTSKATPLNLKIRVRKKDKALFKQGVVSVPKLGQPKQPPEEIRLVSSDQTVLSFKVFVDTQPDKKLAKKRKRFFGGCLSSEDNDDDPYIDSKPATASKSTDIVNQNFGISKNLQDMQLQPKKPIMFLGNRCKPGGCLDPPIDEDKYLYEPNDNNRKVSVQEHSEVKKIKLDLLTNEAVMKKITTEDILKEAELLPAEEESNKEEMEIDNKSVQNIYQADLIKSSLDAQYSDSIITYPTDDIAEDISDKFCNPKRTSDEIRKSFVEFRGSYFTPPKSATNSRNDSDTDKGIRKVEPYVAGRHSSENKRIFSKVDSEVNAIPNQKFINDPQIISGIENTEILSKTSILENKSNLGIALNELQSEKDTQLSKKGIDITTALNTGALLTTTLLIAETAKQKLNADEDNNEIQSERDNEIRKVIKEPQSTLESLNNDLSQEKDEETCENENDIQIKRQDTISGIPETKTEKNETLNDIYQKEITSTKEISRETKEDDPSQDFLNTQDHTIQDKFTERITSTQSTDQPLEKHSKNEDNLSKVETIHDKLTDTLTSTRSTDQPLEKHSKHEENLNNVETDKGSRFNSYVDENKDKMSIESCLLETEKGSIVNNNTEANKTKQTSRHQSKQSGGISGNVDNIKEEQQDLDKRIQAAEEEKKLFDTDALVEQLFLEHEESNRDLHEVSLKRRMSDKININEINNGFQYSDKAQQLVTQIEGKNQDANKYEDADMSDNTFYQHVTEDKLQFKDNQQINVTDDNEHDKVNDSMRVRVVQKQNVGKDTLEPTGHQVINPYQDKGRNIEEENLNHSFEKIYDANENINEAFEKYNEHYEQSSLAYNFVNMDITFHSYTNDQNERVIKTFDTLKNIKRRPQDNVTIIKSQIQISTPHVIKIPIDKHRNMILEVKASGYQKPSSSLVAGADTRGSDNDENFTKVPSQKSQTAISEIESVQNLLSAIYEQQLLPLQSLISDLKKDVDILTTQQMYLKENWKSKRAKTIKLTHSSRKCVCVHKKINFRK